MQLQYISDPNGQTTAVVIPIQEWNEILDTHSDIKERAASGPARQRSTMGAYRGILSSERAEELTKYVEQSREEWDRNS
jgi:hypothetical protein